MADKKNDHLIIAYFPNEDAAKEAADSLIEWDKELQNIKFHELAIITMNKKGKLKTHNFGDRAAGKGAKWGTAIGAVAGILTGGIGLIGGAVVGLAAGSIAGSLFHKRLGMDDKDKERLEEHLKEGGAALAVMADDYELDSTKDKLGYLGGEVASYNVPADAVDELEAVDQGDEAVEEDVEVVETDADESSAPQAVLHYQRHEGDYEGWGLHVWIGYEGSVDWDAHLPPSGSDDFGIYFEVPVAENAEGLSYIIHKGDEKDLWEDQHLDFSTNGYEVWIVQSTPGYAPPPAAEEQAE